MTAAKYGHAHQQLRATLLAALVDGDPCPRCQKPMHASQRLDLGHTDDGTAYHGLEHASCNYRAAARKGNRRRATGYSWP